eukprot:8818417-Pyramimonas_sp.AAC.1
MAAPVDPSPLRRLMLAKMRQWPTRRLAWRVGLPRTTTTRNPRSPKQSWIDPTSSATKKTRRAASRAKA